MSLSSGRARILFPLGVACVGLAMLPRLAWGDGEEDATLRHGLDLRREGKDQEALEEFQKAYAYNKTARALAQIGLAEQALGRWVDAEGHVEQALSDQTQPWIHKNSAALRSAFEEIRRHIGSLEVIGPPEAEVRINGQLVGTLPFSKPARVPIGVLNVEVRKEGYLPSIRTVSISAGLLTRENISLQVIESTPQRRFETAPVSAPDVQPISPPPVSGVSVEGEAARGDATQSASGNWQRPVAWVAAAAAVLGVLGGGGALLLRADRINEASNLRCNVMNETVNPVDPANAGQCLSLADSASSMGVAAVVMFSVAGALAIGSGVLFATMPSKAAATGRLACAAVLAAPGAVCQLRF